MLKPMTDSELAKSASQGDREAFQRLLERHYDMIHRVALTGDNKQVFCRHGLNKTLRGRDCMKKNVNPPRIGQFETSK